MEHLIIYPGSQCLKHVLSAAEGIFESCWQQQQLHSARGVVCLNKLARYLNRHLVKVESWLLLGRELRCLKALSSFESAFFFVFFCW